MYVCSFICTSLHHIHGIYINMLVKVSQVVYIPVATYQKAFIFIFSYHDSTTQGPCPWVGLESKYRTPLKSAILFLAHRSGKYQNKEKPLKRQRKLGLATRKPIISRMGSKFSMIRPGTYIYELPALECLEKSP